MRKDLYTWRLNNDSFLLHLSLKNRDSEKAIAVTGLSIFFRSGPSYPDRENNIF